MFKPKNAIPPIAAAMLALTGCGDDGDTGGGSGGDAGVGGAAGGMGGEDGMGGSVPAESNLEEALTDFCMLEESCDAFFPFPSILNCVEDYAARFLRQDPSTECIDAAALYYACLGAGSCMEPAYCPEEIDAYNAACFD